MPLIYFCNASERPDSQLESQTVIFKHSKMLNLVFGLVYNFGTYFYYFITFITDWPISSCQYCAAETKWGIWGNIIQRGQTWASGRELVCCTVCFTSAGGPLMVQLQSTAVWFRARALRRGRSGCMPLVWWWDRAVGLSPILVWAHTATSYNVPAVRFVAGNKEACIAHFIFR